MPTMESCNCEKYLDCISQLIPTCHANDFCCQRDYWLQMAPCPPLSTNVTTFQKQLNNKNLTEYEKAAIWTNCDSKWPYDWSKTTVSGPANQTVSTSSLSSTTLSSTSIVLETTTVNITGSNDVLIPFVEPSTTQTASVNIGIVFGCLMSVLLVILIIAIIICIRRKKVCESFCEDLTRIEINLYHVYRRQISTQSTKTEESFNSVTDSECSIKSVSEHVKETHAEKKACVNGDTLL